MRHRLFFILLLSGLLAVSLPTVGQSSFSKAELQLGVLFQHLKKDTLDANKKLINDSIYNSLTGLLTREVTLDYEFKSIDGLRRVKASNGKVVVYTWCYLTSEDEIVFSGVVQRKYKGEIKLYPLVVKEHAYTPEENGEVACDDWYGAAYYEIYPFLSKKGVAYVLLGWAQNKKFVTMKTMDVLWFEKDEAHLGLPVWQVLKNEYQSRVIFQYNNDVSTTLLYEQKNKRFVFDHLVPLNSGMVGNYVYYAPDSSYDAYKKKMVQRCWVLQQNVEVE